MLGLDETGSVRPKWNVVNKRNISRCCQFPSLSLSLPGRLLISGSKPKAALEKAQIKSCDELSRRSHIDVDVKEEEEQEGRRSEGGASSHVLSNILLVLYSDSWEDTQLPCN